MGNVFMFAFELIINLYQGLAFMLFFNKFLGSRFGRRKDIISLAVATLAFFAGISASNYINADTGGFAYYEGLIFLAVSIPYCVLCLKGEWYMRVLMPIIAYAVNAAVSFGIDYFLTAILEVDYGFLLQSNIYRVFFVVTVNIIFTLVLYLICKIYRTRVSLKSYSDFIVFLIIPLIAFVITLLAVAVATDNELTNRSLVFLGVIVLSVFSITIIMLNLMVKITKSYEIKTQNMLIKKEQELYKAEVSGVNKNMREISKVKHDMKNRLLCISEMIRDGRFEEAQSVCGSAGDELNANFDIHNTGNVFLNSILNVVGKKARENNIDLSLDIRSNLKEIDGTDLITVVGNLSDNAIEALKKEENNRLMSISLIKKGCYYIVAVKNHINNSVLKGNPDLKSHKPDKMYHGHGLNSVKRIVEKYDGEIKIFEENEMFTVNLMLTLPNTLKNRPNTTKGW